MVAAGMKIDTNKAERFGAIIDRVYENPFSEPKPKEPKTAAEVKQYLIDKIDEL